MSTEFAPNIVVFGDIAGFGQWLVKHYRQHLNYNSTLANKVSVASITLIAGGSGYTTAPAVTITGGSGSGATATAGVSGGHVNALVLTGRGFGYSPTDVLTVNFGGPGTGAAATVALTKPVLIAVQPILTMEGGKVGMRSWLDSHENWHEDIRPFANLTGINLADVDLSKQEQFDQWLSLHGQEHEELDLAFGLA